MIDYWEVLGRLATDDALRAQLYRDFPVGEYPYDGNGCGIQIPWAALLRAREVIRPVMKTRPLSVMGLGEVLMSISTNVFRTRFQLVIDEIDASDIETSGRSHWFYAALGLMLVDNNIMTAFSNGGDVFAEAQFGELSGDEADDLQNLALDGKLVALAADLCYVYWSQGCYDKYMQWELDITQTYHVHPVATKPYPARERVRR